MPLLVWLLSALLEWPPESRGLLGPPRCDVMWLGLLKMVLVMISNGLLVLEHHTLPTLCPVPKIPVWVYDIFTTSVSVYVCFIDFAVCFCVVLGVSHQDSLSLSLPLPYLSLFTFLCLSFSLLHNSSVYNFKCIFKSGPLLKMEIVENIA